MSTQQEGNPTQTKAILTMEEGGKIILELDRAQAPLTTDNFVKLAQSGFYDGLIFHRVIPGFMIQGGCPDGTGMGGPGYQIKGGENPLKHTRGVISMARAMHPDAAGSQFFIMHRDAPHLDGQYAAFGRVVEGLDVVDRIASVETGRQDRPVVAQKIASITIEVA
jgi:peptidyl-prolyl cis-trans isomerase B (cyclophilin B)